MKYSVEEILDYFAGYIERELGIVYGKDHYFQLQNRIEEVAKFQNLNSIDEVYEKAKVGLDTRSRQFILDLATNNETSFFRDPRVFNNLREYLTKLVSSPDKRDLQIWSAACSSGQEAISICITLKEIALQLNREIDFQITCSDISDRILEKARQGAYTQFEVQRGLSTPLLLKYFTKADGMWKAKPEVMKHLRFEKFNLLEPFSYRRVFDVVMCRNVLLYQNVERKVKIIERIYDTLKDEGILILGAGESLIGLSEAYKTRIENEVVFYQKSAKATSLKAA